MLDIKGASFKQVYGILLCMQIGLSFTIVWASKKGKISYLVWVSLIIFAEGGHFTLLPNVVKKVYG